MKTVSKWILLIAIIISGCKGQSTEEGGFSFLDDEDSSSQEVQDGSEIVSIETFSPTANPVVFITGTEKTFGVSVNSGAGSVEYKFLLDSVSVQQSNIPFYTLDYSSLSSGVHTLEIVATNSLGSDSHSFNIIRNTAPTATWASNTATSINCSSDTFNLVVNGADADGDNLSFSFLLNGSTGSAYLSGSSTASSGSVVFTPNCGFVGLNTITVRVTDARGEYTDYAHNVTVANPNSASIDSYSPMTNPTVILSNSSVDFILSASGNPPLAFAWDISPGSTIAACNNLSTCTVSGTDFSPGAYILSGTVTDSITTSDFQNYNIVINDKPTITTSSPNNGSTIGMNCSTNKNFSINIEDQNFSNPGQTFTVNWYIDGNANAALSATTNTASHPIVSTATFSPNCSSLLLGDHTISVVVTDGYESSTTSWNINTNYFSEACNNLSAGEICTLAGLPGMRSGIAGTDPSQGVYPNDMLPHPTGGWFISDTYFDVVWFYNTTGSSKSVLGKTVAAGEISVVVGTGLNGLGTEGQNARNFFLNEPRGLAYSSTGILYIADYSNNRVIQVSSSGVASYFAGGGSSNTDGASRTSHKCNGPLSISLDEANNKLFVACYNNTTNNTDGGIKYFMTNADEGHTLIRKGSANTDGTNGIAGSSRIRRTYSIIKHPGRDIIFAGELETCQLMAISYGDAENYYNSAVSLSANNATRLTFNAGCANTLNRSYSDTGGRLRPYSLAVKPNGAGIDGIFISNTANHNITFLNTTNSSITIGGQSISAGYYNNVFGTGSANKVRATPAATASNLNGPLGIYADNTYLYVADRNNYEVIKLDHSIDDGNVSVIAGNLTIGGYDGESPETLTTVRLNNPNGMDYDSDSNRLFFSDSLNYRLREIDLATGQMSTTVGRGQSGASNTNPEAPFDAYLRLVRDINYNSTKNGLFYSDTEANTGVNRNCLSRFFNESGSTQSVLGQTIPNNRINTVAGNYLLGCATWNIADEGNSATSTALYEPWGILSDDNGTNLYLSSNNGHCIQKIDNLGNISTTIGSCGNAGDISGGPAFARLNNVGDLAIDPDPTYRAFPNFFIVDRTYTTGSFIKYMNNSGSNVTIASVTVGPGEVGKIITGLHYAAGVAAFENQICYSQGAGANGSTYEHTVTCIDRTTGLQTLRVGRSAASTVKGGIQHLEEDEGVSAGSAIIAEPFGITFDSAGNLYISLITSNVIKKVKRWF